MSVRVLFNQWFSSIAPVIEDLKKQFNDDIYVIGTSLNKNHAYKDVCDKFIVENAFEHLMDKDSRDKAYVDQMLNICADEDVDVFFVRKNAMLIAKNRRLFEHFGIKLVLEDASVLEILDSKSSAYNALSADFSDIIPNYINLRGLAGELLRNTAYNVVKNSGCNGGPLWCLKLDTDEGGGSYRLIEGDTELDFDSLRYIRFNRLSKQETLKLLENCSEEEINKLIFMEKLESPEISVDCYNSRKGFIAICREKLPGTRLERIYRDKWLASTCERLARTLGLTNIFNAQFMFDSSFTGLYRREKIRLLEINPRMSGGTYYQTMLGLNLADVCLRDKIGDTSYNIDDYLKFNETTVTHVEKAMIIEEE